MRALIGFVQAGYPALHRPCNAVVYQQCPSTTKRDFRISDCTARRRGRWAGYGAWPYPGTLVVLRHEAKHTEVEVH